NPVGTGPFRFVEWVKDDHLTLKRFDGYWEAGLPHLDEVVYRPIPDSSVRFTAMRTGQIDIMHQIHPKDVATAKTERGMKVSEIASLWWQGIHLNNQVAPFTTKAVRQAVWYAVDRSVIQRVAYFGSGAPGWGPFPPSMWAQDRDFTDWKRDPAKVKAKLAEGGMPNGFAFTVKGWNQPTQIQELQIVQAELKEVGVDMKIELLEFGKLLADLNSHNFAALRIGWSGGPAPDGNAHVFLHSKGGLNRVRYSNPKMDELLPGPERGRPSQAQSVVRAGDAARRRGRPVHLAPPRRRGEGVERARQRVRAHLGRHDAVQRGLARQALNARDPVRRPPAARDGAAALLREPRGLLLRARPARRPGRLVPRRGSDAGDARQGPHATRLRPASGDPVRRVARPCAPRRPGPVPADQSAGDRGDPPTVAGHARAARSSARRVAGGRHPRRHRPRRGTEIRRRPCRPRVP